MNTEGLSRNTFILTGMHRSGTTFLGNVISKADKTYTLHEPFNRKYGLSGIEYDYMNLEKEENNYASKLLLELLAHQKLSFVKKSEKDQLFKSFLRFAIGGKTQRQWNVYRHLFPNHKLALKDPFLVKSIDYLGSEFNLKSIAMIRHPCAVWNSIKTMNWNMDLSKYCDKELSLRAETLSFNSELEKFCFVWSDITEYLLQVNKANTMILKHEDLCNEPKESIKKCLDFVKVDTNEAINEYIENTMYSKHKEKKSEKLHDFKRDASKLNESWKVKLDKKEIDFILENTTLGKLSYHG